MHLFTTFLESSVSSAQVPSGDYSSCPVPYHYGTYQSVTTPGAVGLKLAASGPAQRRRDGTGCWLPEPRLVQPSLSDHWPPMGALA